MATLKAPQNIPSTLSWAGQR